MNKKFKHKEIIKEINENDRGNPLIDVNTDTPDVNTDIQNSTSSDSVTVTAKSISSEGITVASYQPKSYEKYVDLRNNGRLFPSWILKNFKEYKLPPILRKENEDPCNINVKIELRKYQDFIGKFLNPTGPYNDILLYHGLGSGKTATAINVLNLLYNYDHNSNIIILIKASLQDDPWLKDLRLWAWRDASENNVQNISKLRIFKNIHFVHYDSPYAEKDFLNVIKSLDISRPTLYIIDEVHNFIRNVYSNINSKIGKRAQVIYEYILRERKENNQIKIILMSATPGINTPFEIALMFNLLRPGLFPSSELDFNKLFITQTNYAILNPLKKNMFQRRIMGLVSYYIGATPDLYAKQELHYIDLVMTEYQYNIYRNFEKIEEKVQAKAKRYGKTSQLYRTYTRQACNFVFPYVDINVSGELRPRPNSFRISEKVADALEKGKLNVPNPTSEQLTNAELYNNKQIKQEEQNMLGQYFQKIEEFIKKSEKYFMKIHQEDTKTGHTIYDDLENFRKNYDKYQKKITSFFVSGKKSTLFTELHHCSPKMLAIAFLSYISPGKVMIYSNYVVMEGIEMMKVYLKLCGFHPYSQNHDYKGYCEYHGRIDPKIRTQVKNMFNTNNIYGDKCKIILLSPSATEGIQLLNIRQEHILEPYWTEVRIQQVIGRGVRQCSHKDLPYNERIVEIYRYKILKPKILDEDDNNKFTTDEYIEDAAKNKANLIESFLTAMKEVAIDCELFKAHNMISKTYNCFKFPEETLIHNNVGPAYKEDIKDDIKYDAGLNATNYFVERIKVIKILAVYQLKNGVYSGKDVYWYYPKSNIVYDFETHYPIGIVKNINGLPNKLDKDTYIISDIIKIPTIIPTTNL